MKIPKTKSNSMQMPYILENATKFFQKARKVFQKKAGSKEFWYFPERTRTGISKLN